MTSLGMTTIAAPLSGDDGQETAVNGQVCATPYSALVDHAKNARTLAHVLALIEEHRQVEIQLNREIDNRKLIAAIFAKAISAPSSQFLRFCLDQIGLWLQAHAAALFWLESESGQFQPQFEYWSRSASIRRPAMETQSLMLLDTVQEVLHSKQPLYCTNRAVLDAGPLKALFQDQDGAGALFLPLCSPARIVGLCCVGIGATADDLEKNDIQVLMTVMGIMAHWREARAISSELDESQALNQQMLQLSPSGIYRVDFRKNRLVNVNAFLCQYTGYSEEELLTMDPEELLTPASRLEYRKRSMDFLAGRDVPVTVEYQIRTKDGDVQWARIHTRFYYEEGQVAGAIVVAHNITEQKKIMQELVEYREKLEALVEERTRALLETNEKLSKEIAVSTRTARQLQLRTQRLKELNTAMGVLLDKRNEDRLLAQEHLRVNIRQLVEPYLDRLAASGLDPVQHQLLDVVRMNIGEVASAPMPDVAEKYYIFSPGELQVANLIRNGKNTKDIARLLHLSSRTVEAYRNSIRKKLGLQNRRVNLRTYLSSKD